MKQLLGEDHPNTLLALFNLAESLRLSTSLGQPVPFSARFHTEEGLHRQVLTARQRVLGPDHPDSLKSADILALTLFSQRRFDEAAELLAKTYTAQGDDEAAVVAFEEITQRGNVYY